MSTYSSNLRIELITNGTQAGTWGDTTNNNLAYVLDTSIAGYQTVSVTAASQALTYTNGPTSTAANNQAVYAMLRFTTTTGAAFAVYAPPASKMYIVWNNSGQSMTIYNSTVIGNTTAAGTGITVANGNKVLVWSDATNFYEVLAQNLTGTLAIANGGTGQTTANAALNALLPAQTSNANKYLQTNGTDTSWDAISLSTSDITGTLGVANGGTGQSSYAIGDLLYADATTTLAKLADVATGNALISGGVSTAPSWGKIGLTTHVSGTLPVSNGGTGQTTALTQYGVIYGSTTTAMATTLAGTSTQVLHGNATGAPTWGSVSLTADVSGTLPVGNGGTNITTYSTGDTLYSSAANTLAKLAGNTTTTRKYLVSVGTGSAATAPTWDDIDISTSDITGTLAATNGGTGQSTVTTGDLLYGSATNTWSKLTAGTSGYALISNGAGVAPGWGLVSLSSGVSGTLAVANGGTGSNNASGARTNLGLVIGTDVLAPTGSAANLTNFPTFNQNTTGSAASLSATLVATSGGTGQSTVTTGDLLYGSATNTWSKLAAGTSGYALISNGAGVAPGWGLVSLSGGVSGTLGVTYGGTGGGSAATARINLGLVIGTDVLAPTGSAANLTNFPTFNQNTTGTAAALSTASGSAPSYSARAWVNFNGTGTVGTNQTINASGNVASVFKNSAGNYTVTFSTAMADANYAAVAGMNDASFTVSTNSGTKTASSFVVTTYQPGGTGPTDSSNISVVVFR